jgi:cellulose synthase operon protein C
MLRAKKRPLQARPESPDSFGAGRSARTALRLAVTRGGLGIEVDRPFCLGFLEIRELFVSLVGLSFPVDLSGGVGRFRHRRGALERIVVGVQHDRLVRAVAPRLRAVLGEATPSVTVAPIAGGAMIGMALGTKALAFDLFFVPREGDARWVAGNARSIGLEGTSIGVAIAAMDAFFRGTATRSGAVYSTADAAALIARHLLPTAGARAPDARDVRWGELQIDSFGWTVACDRAFSPPLYASHVVRELEFARLAERGDTALASGSIDEARSSYVSLLSQSPRDADGARRLADVDRAVSGRAEAALATLADAMPMAEAGVLAAELLESSGKRAGARLAFEQAAEREPYGPLAGLSLLRAARLADNARHRMDLLDKAVACAPALAQTRWTRFEARLRMADVAGAMADAEHLEAATTGARERHDVWKRAAEQLLSNGHHSKAASLFERALRYAPDEPESVAGLARSLLSTGRAGRALDLLARASEIAQARGLGAHDITLALARALAEAAHDLPHAIARLRSIPPGYPESVEARALEGRYRAQLGDLAGATIAFATMRDAIEIAKDLEPRAAAALLVEAARFETEHKRDRVSAQRHLGTALGLVPNDAAVLAAFRSAGAKDARGRSLAVDAPADLPGHEDDERMLEVLTDRLRSNPNDCATAIQLGDILARLGKDMDLFALLSAQLEQADGADRDALVPRQKAVLDRLADAARRDGRDGEARLYEDARRRLDEPR